MESKRTSCQIHDSYKCGTGSNGNNPTGQPAIVFLLREKHFKMFVCLTVSVFWVPGFAEVLSGSVNGKNLASKLILCLILDLLNLSGFMLTF